jgi:hypothetical protein
MSAVLAPADTNSGPDGKAAPNDIRAVQPLIIVTDVGIIATPLESIVPA